MTKLKHLAGKAAASAASAVMLMTAVQFPAASAAEEPVLRMNLMGGGSVIGIGYQLEVPDALSAYTVTLDGEKVTPAEDGTFEAYEYAAYMTQPHTVTVRKGGRQILKKETSVCSYLNTLLADSESSAYHNAAKAMLVYGGAAQAYFGIDTEHPADAGIDKDGLPAPELPEDIFPTPPRAFIETLLEKDIRYRCEMITNIPVTYTGMNLSLQSEIQFSLFFEPKAEYTAKEAEEYLKACTFGGEPAVVTPYGENGFRMSRTVNVKDLGETIVLEEPEFGPCDFRPTQYLYLAEQSGDEALIRVCKALYNYGLIAQYSPNVIREIGLQMDEYWDWMVSEIHAYMMDDEGLERVMLDEDDSKKFELSLPEQLCIERTDKSGQTVKIPVLKENTLRTDHYWEALSYPEWVNQTKYEAAEHTLCSGDPDREWSHVSARFGQGNDTDVLVLYFTLYELADSPFGIQSLKLDENGKLTVRTSICNENDYGGGEEIYAYRFELPKGALSGEWMPEDSGEQPPEEDPVIRGVHLDTDYYYDLEEIEERAEWVYDWEPEPDMLTKDPEAFRASLPDTLCIERTDGTGRTVQIPVLKQEKYDGWYCENEDNPWYYQKYEGPEWLKKNDYKAAERNLCDPMFGMQRVSAHFEQGDETDVLTLYFTWKYMDGDLELQGLQFDENGELTVRTAFCRTTPYGWGSDLYSYRLEFPKGTFSGEYIPKDTGEEQPGTDEAVRSLELKIDSYYEPLFETTCFDDWDTQQTETTAEVRDYKAFKASLPDELTIEKTDGDGQTVQIPVTVFSRTLGERYDYQEKKYGWDWSGNPEFQAAYEAAEASLVSPTVVLDAASGLDVHVSANLEPGEETDTLWLFFPMVRSEGHFGIQGIRLDENGRMTVSAAVYDGGGCEPETVLEVCRLELPHGAL